MLKKPLLRAVARASGLQCSYRNVDGVIVWSPDKTLIKMIEDLSGQKIFNNYDLELIWSRKVEQKYSKGLKQSTVLWQGDQLKIDAYSKNELSKNVKLVFRNEANEEYQAELKLSKQEKTKHGFHGKYVDESKSINLPIGYFKLTLLEGNRSLESFLICAPKKLAENENKSWGPFVPLYALRSNNDWGIGSFKEARELALHLKNYGAKWIALLPMLAQNFDHVDCDPSPYSSLSRLFWNEIFLDVESLIVKYKSFKAKDLFERSDEQRKLKELRENKYVKYFEVYQNKKKYLKILAEEFFEQGLDKQDNYQNFLKENVSVVQYANFRSKEPSEIRFHKFVQFEMTEALSNFEKETGISLYMDYPVGVNDSGFDYKEFRKVFYGEVSVGAPPEPVFQLGQDWGFPAFHPEKMIEDKYHYFAETIKNHMRFSNILRLDHIMGLYRIYSVPKGFKGSEGVYLRFPKEDLFAVVILEAYKNNCHLIGENLGTVPLEVDKIIREKNLNGMWVYQCSTYMEPKTAFETISKNSLVCINTHDMPMLKSFEIGSDLELVNKLKILSDKYKDQFKISRSAEMSAWKKHLNCDYLVEEVTKKLSASKANYFVLNLEDCWLEEEPQNIPGTWKEYPNWRKKFHFSVEEIKRSPMCERIFQSIHEARK